MSRTHPDSAVSSITFNQHFDSCLQILFSGWSHSLFVKLRAEYMGLVLHKTCFSNESELVLDTENRTLLQSGCWLKPAAYLNTNNRIYIDISTNTLIQGCRFAYPHHCTAEWVRASKDRCLFFFPPAVAYDPKASLADCIILDSDKHLRNFISGSSILLKADVKTIKTNKQIDRTNLECRYFYSENSIWLTSFFAFIWIRLMQRQLNLSNKESR